MTGGSRSHAGLMLFSQLRRDFDELFQEVIAAGESPGQAPTWRPATDILELEDAVLVLVEVPGLAPEDLEVQVEGTVLSVRGRRQLSFAGSEEGCFHCLERREGSFARRLEVATSVNFAAARAELRAGVLTIELPKLEDRRRRRRVIPVTAAEEEP